MLRSCIWGAFVGLGMASQVVATPFVIPIDESGSNVTVELCILGPDDCDADTSPVAGTMTISLDDATAPTAITLHDFDMQLTEPIDIYIPVFLGSLTATGTGISMTYAAPGTPFGPVPVAGEAFVFADVPALLTGTVSYTAAGSACVALQALGLPCTDAINLADQGVQAADLDGTIVVVDGVATITSNPAITTPLDPANPSLGTLSVSGTVTGSATVPPNIPTMSEWGLIVLAALLVGSGIAVARRRAEHPKPIAQR